MDAEVAPLLPPTPPAEDTRPRARPRRAETYVVAAFSVLAFVSVTLLSASALRRHYAGGGWGAHRHGARSPASAPPLLGSVPASEALTFAVIGDWGRDGSHKQTAVAGALARAAAAHDLRFVVSSGDNFYDGGVDSTGDSQWRTSFEDVYKQRSLVHAAWFSVLGNHDHLGNVAAQVDYSGLSRRWTMPAPYYTQTFTLGGVGGGADAAPGWDVQMVFIDTTPFVRDAYGKAARKLNGQKPDVQLDWLRGVFANSTADAIVVVGHHNMYTMTTSASLGVPEMRAYIEPVLLAARGKVITYISGHEHSLQHLQPYGEWGRGGAAAVASGEAVVHGASPVGGAATGEGGMDHFISGGGSKLDPMTPPSRAKAGMWLHCCGVLAVRGDTDAKSQGADSPRAVWGAESHGFYVFEVTREYLAVVAYDEGFNRIYSYERLLGGKRE
ncbi:hypothetical protein BU14_0504s0014 [Porphyra umbilicalis]|uniref:Calcineurin-like phosphoesterase domain-containing protein n=1 Tax=Porphyra umbilicalis TaxID=2786 RepID=A0A1X6NT31_PORUM|nr:hypothetical protein BU14_0504s0014 [Porphyra umbilicalis]|eukprot:OSX71761.1 hypothetical protein BU14_0504s0014 [Porphyra umbilicalis]